MFDQELIAGLDRYISPRLIVEKECPCSFAGEQLGTTMGVSKCFPDFRFWLQAP